MTKNGFPTKGYFICLNSGFWAAKCKEQVRCFYLNGFAHICSTKSIENEFS